MPRRRSQSQKRGLILGTIGVLFGMGLLALLSYLSGQGSIDLSNLADRDFEVGDTERLAARIAEDRQPLIFDDPVHDERYLYVDHAGGPADEGWIAVLAGTRACPLEYVGGGYVDCEGNEYPRSGEGLTRYRTYVEDGTVYVDLRTEVS